MKSDEGEKAFGDLNGGSRCTTDSEVVVGPDKME
jgi:hypothetical protein